VVRAPRRRRHNDSLCPRKRRLLRRNPQIRPRKIRSHRRRPLFPQRLWQQRGRAQLTCVRRAQQLGQRARRQFRARTPEPRIRQRGAFAIFEILGVNEAIQRPCARALLALAHHSHCACCAACGTRIQLHHGLVHVPGSLDQRIRHRRPHLPALQQARALGIAMAHLPPDLHHIPGRQYLPRTCTFHPTGWRPQRRGIPLDCVPCGWCRRSASRCGVLGVLDQAVAEVGRVSDRE
jgi:hypothetical protein